MLGGSAVRFARRRDGSTWRDRVREAGLARCVVVVGFETVASHLMGDDVRMLYGMSFDSEVEGFAGVTPAALCALDGADNLALGWVDGAGPETPGGAGVRLVSTNPHPPHPAQAARYVFE